MQDVLGLPREERLYIDNMPAPIGNKNSLGFKHSKETRLKMSKSHKGIVTWNKGMVGLYEGSANSFYGKRHSEETKERMSVSAKERFSCMSYEQRKTYLEHLRKTGSEHPRYIQDRTKLSMRQERNDSAYREWRKGVWIRDGFKCRIENKDCNGGIESHHILSWKEFVELRYNVNNGITLCHAHHPRKRAEEKRLESVFQTLVSVSSETI